MFTVPDLLTRQAHTHPDAPAVLDGPNTTTYAELLQHAERGAATLAAQHTPGARIALLLPRSTDALAAYFAAHLAGLVPVQLHTQLAPANIARITDHSQAAAIITTTRLAPLVRDVPDHLVQDLTHLNSAAMTRPALRTRTSTDLAQLIYTSGSTGDPKGVMVSHGNLLAGAATVAAYLHLAPNDKVMALMPWSFDYGLNQVLAAFHAGGCTVIQRSPNPAHITATLTRHQVTGLAAVPSVWSALTAPGSPLLDADLPHLRYLTNTGGPLPQQAITSLRRRHPHLHVYSMYGLTEAFRATALGPDLLDSKPTSVGRAVPGSEVWVVDDQGRRCPPHGVGEVVQRGPTVALGYWRDDEATRRVFRPHPDPAHPWTEPVVYSGDLGYLDDDGDLHLIGRADEQVKLHGVRVTPAQIDAELGRCPLIGQAVAVLPPGTDAVDILVVPGTGFTRTAFLAYCRAELPAYMQPRTVRVVDTIPVTGHGKPDRHRAAALLDTQEPA